MGSSSTRLISITHQRVSNNIWSCCLILKTSCLMKSLCWNCWISSSVFEVTRTEWLSELTLTLHLRDKDDHHVSFYSAQGDYLASKWARINASNLRVNWRSQHLFRGWLYPWFVMENRKSPKYYDLFDGNNGTLAALDLLAASLLGQVCIQTTEIQHDPRPEKANQYSLPTLGNTEKRNKFPKISRNKLRQLPTSANNDSDRVFYCLEPEALTESVTLSQGPERIVSGWWDGEKIIRDYFIAHSENGRWLVGI